MKSTDGGFSGQSVSLQLFALLHSWWSNNNSINKNGPQTSCTTCFACLLYQQQTLSAGRRTASEQPLLNHNFGLTLRNNPVRDWKEAQILVGLLQEEHMAVKSFRSNIWIHVLLWMVVNKGAAERSLRRLLSCPPEFDSKVKMCSFKAVIKTSRPGHKKLFWSLMQISSFTTTVQRVKCNFWHFLAVLEANWATPKLHILVACSL